MYAVGLMSGTSLDGIDAAIIQTDGTSITAFGPSLYQPYPALLREKISALLGKTGVDVQALARDITLLHADSVFTLLDKAKLAPKDIHVIGFHGQTIWHRPPKRLDGYIQQKGATHQIGDGALLAERTGIDVVGQFRLADMEAGGQGAPLVPVYHLALVRDFASPVMLVNIGGISNVTWIGGATPADLTAFDTGPGNTLLDRWMLHTAGQAYDKDGQYAAQGRVDLAALKALRAQASLDQPPPKSFDRLDFDFNAVSHLTLEDGAATLTMLTAQAIASAIKFVPQIPRQWILMGGGRSNLTLRMMLKEVLGNDANVAVAEDFGWDGDMIEAQAFAFLAVRSLRDMPITFPNTTGVEAPLSGGVLYSAPK